MGEDFKVTVKDASESKVVSSGQSKTPTPAPAEQQDSTKKLLKKGGD